MEKCDISLTNSKLKILQRNLVFLLNATLWILVLYFSIDDDKVAALLSYVTVTFTVITLKYCLWGVISYSESVTFFIDYPSKILIFVGIFLALPLQFWNTAFYSICLGIIIQKVKSEIEIRAAGVSPYLSMEVINGKSKTDSIDEFHLCNTFNDISHGMQIRESKVNDLNSGNCCTDVNLNGKSYLCLRNITDEQDIDVKIVEYAQNESQNFHKLNESHCSVSETISDHETISNEDCHGNPEEFCKLENVLDDYNSFLTEKDNLIDVETSLKNKKQTLQQNTGSNDNTLEIQRNGRLCTMRVNLFNLKDLELSECAVLESKFELNEDNIKRELERNEQSVDNLMKDVAVNDKILQDFLKDETKFEIVDNRNKSITESEDKIVNELSQEQVNIDSGIYKGSLDFNLNLIGYENSLQQNEANGIVAETKDSIEDKVNLLPFNDENTSDISCEHKTDIDNGNSEIVETDSKCEIQSEIDKNLDFEYSDKSSTSTKTTYLQSEKETDEESINLNICLRDKEVISEGCNIDFKMDLESNFMNKIRFEGNCVENNENFTAVIKYANVKRRTLKTTDVLLENDVNACEMKLISQQIDGGNPEIIFCESKEILETEHPGEPECLSKSKIINDSLKINESTDVEERIDANEPVTKVSEDADTLQISNVEGVVNRIDLSFIYGV